MVIPDDQWETLLGELSDPSLCDLLIVTWETFHQTVDSRLRLSIVHTKEVFVMASRRKFSRELGNITENPNEISGSAELTIIVEVWSKGPVGKGAVV